MSIETLHLKYLKALIHFSEPLTDLQAGLAKLSWDDHSISVVMTWEHVQSVLERYLSGTINSNDVEDWANLVENREDVDKQPDVRDAIHQLANPLLEGELSLVSAQSILEDKPHN